MSMPYFEAPTEDTTRLPPRDLVRACIEHDARSLLVDQGALPPEFFDLSSGIAGDLVQKLTNYHIRMAVVIPDPTRYSESFEAFVHEANRSGPFRFFASRQRAVEWLTAGC